MKEGVWLTLIQRRILQILQISNMQICVVEGACEIFEGGQAKQRRDLRT